MCTPYYVSRERQFELIGSRRIFAWAESILEDTDTRHDIVRRPFGALSHYSHDLDCYAWGCANNPIS
jgi:hypothetical protein